MTPTRLSYSACQKYERCPAEYKYHYIDRIRPDEIKSSLFYGNAVDKAFSELLNTRSLSKTMKVFHQEMLHTTDVHGNQVYLPNSERASYSANDIDEELLTDKDRAKIEAGEYNVAWASLCRKGHYTLKALHDHFLPKVQEVLGTQVPIELENDVGDKLIGICDTILKMVDGNIVAYDLKTSGVPYERDSVQRSVQLSTYLIPLKEKYGITKCGYLVGIKNIRKNRTKTCSSCNFVGTGTKHATCFNKFGNKRCGGEWDIAIDPEGIIQDIVDDIPKAFLDFTIDNFNQINTGIKNGVFFKNTNACKRAWGDCPYKRLCFENYASGLVDLGKKQ